MVKAPSDRGSNSRGAQGSARSRSTTGQSERFDQDRNRSRTTGQGRARTETEGTRSNTEVNLSEQQLKGAPKYSKHETWDWSDQARGKRVYDYYGVGPYWGS